MGRRVGPAGAQLNSPVKRTWKIPAPTPQPDPWVSQPAQRPGREKSLLCHCLTWPRPLWLKHAASQGSGQWSGTEKPLSLAPGSGAGGAPLFSGCLVTGLPPPSQHFDLSGGLRNFLYRLILRFVLKSNKQKVKGHIQSKVNIMWVESLDAKTACTRMLTVSMASTRRPGSALSFLAPIPPTHKGHAKILHKDPLLVNGFCRVFFSFFFS